MNTSNKTISLNSIKTCFNTTEIAFKVFIFIKHPILNITFVESLLRVDPWSVEVKVIAVSKRNLSKTRHCVHFRQFCPINNSMLALSHRLQTKCWCLTLVPLFEKPRRDGILPLCRAASRRLFIWKTEIAIFSKVDFEKILENFKILVVKESSVIFN